MGDSEQNQSNSDLPAEIRQFENTGQSEKKYVYMLSVGNRRY